MVPVPEENKVFYIIIVLRTKQYRGPVPSKLNFLIKKDYEGGLKHYLTGENPNDSDERDLEKENIFKSWPKFNIKLRSFDLKKVFK